MTAEDSPMAARRKKRLAQIVPIAPRITQSTLQRIVILEWMIREEKEPIRQALLAGATIEPGSLRAEVQGQSIAVIRGVTKGTIKVVDTPKSR
jgi:hypothetical protein